MLPNLSISKYAFRGFGNLSARREPVRCGPYAGQKGSRLCELDLKNDCRIGRRIRNEAKKSLYS